MKPVEIDQGKTLKKISPILILVFFIFTFISVTSGCTNQKEVNIPIVLLTDFGSEDYRVPQLKGIIYSNNHQAKLVDGSHSVPAFDIPTGAFILDIAAREFPENVVFIGVIAPLFPDRNKIPGAYYGEEPTLRITGQWTAYLRYQGHEHKDHLSDNQPETI